GAQRPSSPNHRRRLPARIRRNPAVPLPNRIAGFRIWPSNRRRDGREAEAGASARRIGSLSFNLD
ncbi:unnamed protein product, partial [Musa acuminata subsp. burmannicoides]